MLNLNILKNLKCIRNKIRTPPKKHLIHEISHFTQNFVTLTLSLNQPLDHQVHISFIYVMKKIRSSQQIAQQCKRKEEISFTFCDKIKSFSQSESDSHSIIQFSSVICFWQMYGDSEENDGIVYGFWYA